MLAFIVSVLWVVILPLLLSNEVRRTELYKGVLFSDSSKPLGMCVVLMLASVWGYQVMQNELLAASSFIYTMFLLLLGLALNVSTYSTAILLVDMNHVNENPHMYPLNKDNL